MPRLAAALAVLGLLAAPAAADPWKDESGHGRRAQGPRGQAVVPPPLPYLPAPGPVAGPRVPAGHLPPPGECRPWIPGVPAGQQPPPHRC